MTIAPLTDDIPQRSLPPLEEHFRHVMGHFASGVTVVTALTSGGPAGLTIQSCCSVSIDPPLILFCVGAGSHTWRRLRPARHLCINVLAKEQGELARRFAQRLDDKYAGVNWTPSNITRSPRLGGVLACIECRILREYAGGDHTIVVCRVLGLQANPDAEPLIFYKGAFDAPRAS